jgi:DNA-directed RNA polymerase specialized sigma24 family protein
LPYATALPALLPDLRRFAAALTGSPKARADDLVLRALHQVLREAPVADEAQLKQAMRAGIVRLARNRPESALTKGAGALETALRELPVMHRAALMLINVEHCSYDEAAQVLGISRAVLIGRLTAARQIIARHMQEDSRGSARAPFLRLVK